MDCNEFIKQRASKQHPLHPDHSRDVEACLAVQIHTEGARPRYMGRTRWVEPETYKKKFQALFENRLLNRHPNEAPSMYNWRLSIFSPVAKEIYNKFMNMCKGSLLNANSFTLVVDSNLQKVIETKPVNYEYILEFIMENPVCYIGVMNANEAQSTNEMALPELVCVKCEEVLMYDGKSIAFERNGMVYFIDSEAQYNITKSIKTPHKFNVLPFSREVNSFLQPYQNWADQLVRNLSDDEAMVKNYSYPYVQIVEESCKPCAGTGKIANPDEKDLLNLTVNCGVCKGAGTISHNPGEFLTIAEETLARNGGTMQDRVKFITPDIGIPEYHMKRWMEIYKLCENSLHIKSVVDGVQSGDAKKEDRKDQYFFIQSISNYLFAIIRKNLRFMSWMVNPTNGPQETILIEPKQFDIMSDSDLINEFASLQSKTDDSQTLSELNYIINSKIYRDDPVQAKINDVLYLADPLYGVWGNALKLKLLSGIYTDPDKTIHEKGYMVLKRIAAEMTNDVFKVTEPVVLMDKLIDKIAEMVQVGIYDNFEGGGNISGGLKDSVGGLTGMIEIAKAVASGLYDLEAAIALVSDRFGLTEDEARKQLGTPSITKNDDVSTIAKLT
jgi:hypothetical protein